MDNLTKQEKAYLIIEQLKDDINIETTDGVILRQLAYNKAINDALCELRLVFELNKDGRL